MTIAGQSDDDHRALSRGVAGVSAVRGQQFPAGHEYYAEAQHFVEAALIVAGALLAKFVVFDVVLTQSVALKPFLVAAAIGGGVAYVLLRRWRRGQWFGQVPHRDFPVPIGVLLPMGLLFLVLLPVLYVLKGAAAFEPGWLAIWFALSIALLTVERAILNLHIGRLVAEGALRRRVAIVGTSELAMRVITALREQEPELALAGIFEDGTGGQTSKTVFQGDIDDLIACAEVGGCDRVIVALPGHEGERVSAALQRLSVLPIEVQLCPDALRLPCSIIGDRGKGRLLLHDVCRSRLDARSAVIKRAMDYVLAAIALVALAPALFAIAVAIKLDTPGPVFFRQSRNGFRNTTFRIYKFRSMTVLDDGPVIEQVRRNDDRVTRVGRFLRATSLDELPQLINVLRGELSLVGPRPHAVAHNDQYAKSISNYSVRHMVMPGITGWAQVNGLRGETREPSLMRRRVEADLWYIGHQSLWLDIRILLKTVEELLKARAY